MEELLFEQQAAAEYDKAFAHGTRYFMPFVLRAARIARGMRIVDIACWYRAFGRSGHLRGRPDRSCYGADVSPAMTERARERLSEVRNVSVLVEDAQALSFRAATRVALPRRNRKNLLKNARRGGSRTIDLFNHHAIKLLDERNANGQIDREEYVQRKRDILGKRRRLRSTRSATAQWVSCPCIYILWNVTRSGHPAVRR